MMKLQTEIRIGLGMMLALLLLVSFIALGVFKRMAPAIENILQENVSSLASVEDMLTILAQRHGRIPSAQQQQYLHAFSRAKAHITITTERPLLLQLARHHPALFQGDRTARQRVIALLQRLAQINRTEMRRKDQKAQRLGRAGAWVIVFVGLLGTILGSLLSKRLIAHLLFPLQELEQTLLAAEQGDLYRRANAQGNIAEFQKMARSLNTLLDQRLSSTQERSTFQTPPPLS